MLYAPVTEYSIWYHMDMAYVNIHQKYMRYISTSTLAQFFIHDLDQRTTNLFNIMYLGVRVNPRGDVSLPPPQPGAEAASTGYVYVPYIPPAAYSSLQLRRSSSRHTAWYS